MADELTKALLVEEVADPRAVAQALFASVSGGVPLARALVDAGAVSAEVLARYLARSEAPFLRQVAPLVELVARLPPGLCSRLLAVPVRRDAITGTVDVVVADPLDPHPAREIAFHLGAPVRVVRAPASAIEEAIRRIEGVAPERRGSIAPPAAPRASVHPPAHALRDDERMYDSRPRPDVRDPARRDSLPPPASAAAFLDADALRSSHPPRAAHVVPSASPPPLAARSRNTPPWGTPIHNPHPILVPGSDPPRSGLGSEIPIPLTRRTFTAVTGGTQRPPPLRNPSDSLGEGYPVDPGSLRPIVELRTDADLRPLAPPPMASFIPGPPPVPGATPPGAAHGIPLVTDTYGIVAAIRSAGSRDEVLELVQMGARMVALRVALFVVKRGGYLGWACTPEFGDRAALQSVLLPLDAASVLDEAVREGIYLGPIRHDALHTPLLDVMRTASRDVAIVPIRVAGKTAVVIVADELADTMLATRRLEELARAAGDAFARIVRTRR